MSTTTPIQAPRSGRMSPEYTRNKGRGGNFEMAGWLFMRLSGIVLVVLIFAHLWINMIAGEGIHGIDFGFVAGKWADPFWQIWDLTMLWLAMLHGTNGVRVIINDYAEKDSTRLWLKMILFTATAVIIVLGTLVIFTFDPCPVINGVPHVADYCPAP
jgi:succinate dehydrogenase / fumarate reductase membrane anchor subunit